MSNVSENFVIESSPFLGE